MKFILLCIIFLSMDQLKANEITMALGIASVSFTENVGETSSDTSTVNNKEADVPASGSMSATLLDITYNLWEFPRTRIFVKGEVPLISSGGTGLFMGAVGFDYYIKSYAVGSNTIYSGGEIEIIPKMRYYVGGFAGIDYLVYDTGDAEKSDTLFDLSIHGGIQYRIYKKMDISVEFAIGRGTGVATTTFNTRMFVGASYSP